MVGIEPVMPTDALLRLWILKPPPSAGVRLRSSKSAYV